MINIFDKKFKNPLVFKFQAMLLCIVVVLAGGTLTSSADAINAISNSFSSAWESTIYDTGNSAIWRNKLVYGFDTSGINEDYATAYGSLGGYDGGDNYFRGLVINGTGYHYGDKVYDSRFISSVSVTHSGSSVQYSCLVG